MDRERIKVPKEGRRKSSSSKRSRPTGGIIPERRNMRLAIPKRLAAPGAQETIKQRRLQRRRAKLYRQIVRLFLVIIPLGTTLVFSERMRQRKLQEYVGDIEDKVKQQSHPNVDLNGNETVRRGYNTVNRYPFTGIANATTPMSKDLTAFFWQIPQTGGTTLKNILGGCLELVQASRTSTHACNQDDSEADTLRICNNTAGIGSFVNCDPSDDHGIQRCNKLNVVESGKADVIVSSRFLHAASLFDTDHQARAFTILRDPVERMVSTFYHLREATWEREYDEKFKNMTLLEYARREDTPTNWMVRYLTGNMMKSFTTDEDLELAKKILEKKFYVLLTKELDMGLEMFLKDMKYKVSDDAKKCIKEEMSKLSEKKSIPEINVTSAAIRTLKDKNTLDTELFEFGVKLFTRQWTRRID
jgi:hypothetical protein